MKRETYYSLINFFKKISIRFKKQEPEISYGRDIKFLKEKLAKFSPEEIEQFMLFFIRKSKKLDPKINVALSKNVFRIMLEVKQQRPALFWRVVNEALDELNRKGTWHKDGLVKVGEIIKRKENV